jgi:ribosomal protein S9
MGAARALVKLVPDSRLPLKREKMLIHDQRQVEPKKPTQKKARKKRQWVKR